MQTSEFSESVYLSLVYSRLSDRCFSPASLPNRNIKTYGESFRGVHSDGLGPVFRRHSFEQSGAWTRDHSPFLRIFLKRGLALGRSGGDASFLAQLGTHHHWIPRQSDRSLKSSATTSTSGSGTRSEIWSGPCSRGRWTNAVLNPTAFEAFKSPLWAATINTW